MDTFRRGGMMFVCFSGGCLMAIGLVDVGLYLSKCLLAKPPQPLNVVPIVLNSIPFLAGVAVLIKARAITDWLSDKLE
jgi:hypothetical protein